MKIIVLFWGVFLVTFVAAAAEIPSDELRTQDFDITGSQVSEEEIDYDDGNSIAERKSCQPTLSCTHAGGFCVKKRSSCSSGKLDKNGCRGGKKCQCCLTDITTPAPMTCPVVTNTPCPTPAPMTCPVVTNTPCPTTAPTTCPVVTCTPCPTTDITTPVPTTLIPTTGPDMLSNVTWHVVGNDRFVRFAQQMNWNDARSLCRSYGLNLYHPSNITAVAIYLDNNFSDSFYWLGAKGNGTHQVWLSGSEVVTPADPWCCHKNGATNDCLAMITYGGYPARRIILFATKDGCTGRTNIDVICG